MLNVRQLILLRDLAEHGTIAKVAELHGVTASSVSQNLRALESDVGGTLLRREGRGLRLTPVAEVLLGHAGTVIDAMDADVDSIYIEKTNPAIAKKLLLTRMKTMLESSASSMAIPARMRIP